MSRLSAAGGAAVLKGFEDQLLTQAALDRSADDRRGAAGGRRSS